MEAFDLLGYSPELRSKERPSADLKHVICSKALVFTKAKLQAGADEHHRQQTGTCQDLLHGPRVK